MNLRDLNYFIALADTLHFGKAAKACFISQPSLSIQIKKLENTLGVKLLERTNRSVILTDAGKVIAEHARELLLKAETIQQYAIQAQDPFSGELNIGTISTLVTYLLPHLLPELMKTESYPKLTIYLAEKQKSELLIDLKQGKLDAALLSLPVSNKDLSTQPVFDEALLLAVPKSHPLAKKKFIKPTDLKNNALLLLEEGHCLRTQTLAFCQKYQLQEEKKIRGASLEILRYMVSSNIGIALMPSLSCIHSDSISYIPFENNQIFRTIGLVWRKSSHKILLLNKITDHIVRLLSDKPYIKTINAL